jgi:CDP-glycerol glycerophosphotransferase
MEQVAAEVARRGDLLVLNVHPVEAPQVPTIAPALPSVAFVTPRSDVYPLLRETDVLVTDYSSLMFDYLHLDRPVVLYRPDHARYTRQSRQLFDAKLSTLPGPCVETAQALTDALRRQGTDTHRAARQALRAQLFDAVDGQSAERLWPHLMAQMEAAIASHRAVRWPS